MQTLIQEQSYSMVDSQQIKDEVQISQIESLIEEKSYATFDVIDEAINSNQIKKPNIRTSINMTHSVEFNRKSVTFHQSTQDIQMKPKPEIPQLSKSYIQKIDELFDQKFQKDENDVIDGQYDIKNNDNEQDFKNSQNDIDEEKNQKTYESSDLDFDDDVQEQQKKINEIKSFNCLTNNKTLQQSMKINLNLSKQKANAEMLSLKNKAFTEIIAWTTNKISVFEHHIFLIDSIILELKVLYQISQLQMKNLENFFFWRIQQEKERQNMKSSSIQSSQFQIKELAQIFKEIDQIEQKNWQKNLEYVNYLELKQTNIKQNVQKYNDAYDIFMSQYKILKIKAVEIKYELQEFLKMMDYQYKKHLQNQNKSELNYLLSNDFKQAQTTSTLFLWHIELHNIIQNLVEKHNKLGLHVLQFFKQLRSLEFDRQIIKKQTFKSYLDNTFNSEDYYIASALLEQQNNNEELDKLFHHNNFLNDEMKKYYNVHFEYSIIDEKQFYNLVSNIRIDNFEMEILYFAKFKAEYDDGTILTSFIDVEVFISLDKNLVVVKEVDKKKTVLSKMKISQLIYKQSEKIITITETMKGYLYNSTNKIKLRFPNSIINQFISTLEQYNGDD